MTRQLHLEIFQNEVSTNSISQLEIQYTVYFRQQIIVTANYVFSAERYNVMKRFTSFNIIHDDMYTFYGV